MAGIYRITIQKGFNEPEDNDGVVSDLEPDILECEVKWALESITINKLEEVTEFQLSSLKVSSFRI